MLYLRDFARYVAANNNFTITDANEFVPIVFESLKKAVLEHGEVKVKGLGSFSLKTKKGYSSKNGFTGEPCEVRPYKYIHFKMSSSLKDEINGR